MTHALKIDDDLYNISLPRYISMSLGNVNLLTDQSSIVSVESSNSVDNTNCLKGSIGWLHYNNYKIPVYNINEQIEVVNRLPENKMICAVIKSNNIYISILCNEVATFNNDTVKIKHIPECMRIDSCPIESLCLYTSDNNINIDLITKAETLVKYINNYINQYI